VRGDETATDRALTGPPTLHLSTERLQAPRVLTRGDAHQHLLDDAAIGRGHRLKRRQCDLARCGSHARSLDGDFPTAQDDFALGRARPARRPIGLVRVPRPADGRALLFQHGREDLQPRSQRQFQQLRPCVDEQIDERQMAQW
jgi:hypothetical protein